VLAAPRYTAPEIAFISWVGLRGAVPIFLAIIPVLAGLPDAAIFFGVAFIVVLISLILQGWTVPAAARMFDLDVPPLQQASRLDIDLPGWLGARGSPPRPAPAAHPRSRR
jgi:potassium/hydrogen antiporter